MNNSTYKKIGIASMLRNSFSIGPPSSRSYSSPTGRKGVQLTRMKDFSGVIQLLVPAGISPRDFSDVIVQEARAF